MNWRGCNHQTCFWTRQLKYRKWRNHGGLTTRNVTGIVWGNIVNSIRRPMATIPWKPGDICPAFQNGLDNKYRRNQMKLRKNSQTITKQAWEKDFLVLILECLMVTWPVFFGERLKIGNWYFRCFGYHICCSSAANALHPFLHHSWRFTHCEKSKGCLKSHTGVGKCPNVSHHPAIGDYNFQQIFGLVMFKIPKKGTFTNPCHNHSDLCRLSSVWLSGLHHLTAKNRRFNLG